MTQLRVPLLAALAVLAASLSLASALDRGERLAEQSVVKEVAGRLEGRLEDRVQFLYAVRALFEATHEVDRAILVRFLNSVDAERNAPDMLGVGYAIATSPDDDAATAALIDARYGAGHRVSPEATDQPIRFPIVLLEPDNVKNRAALGYDMYSDEVRRAAMNAAWRTRRPAATDRVLLKQEIDQTDLQWGFLIYLPVFREGDDSKIAGFVYSPFRAEDYVEAALKWERRASVRRVYAGDPVEENLLYTANIASGRTYRQSIDFAGRRWVVELAPAQSGGGGWKNGSIIALVGGIALSALTFAFARSSRLQLATLHRLAEERQARADEKDILLKEMNHRLKNALARVAAVSRISARSASGTKEFLELFNQRLAAMTRAHDMLAQSKWRRTLLRSLVQDEINMIAEVKDFSLVCEGPEIELDETQSQAVGLVVHELVTNSSKYGAVRHDGDLAVGWRVEPLEEYDWLAIAWTERGFSPDAPEATEGFGGRLARLMIDGQLRGAFTREIQENGVAIEMRFPWRARGADAPSGAPPSGDQRR